MGLIYNKAKKIYYFLLELVTKGKGVNVKLNGFHLKLPSKYYRSFPNGYEKDNFVFFSENTPSNAVVLDIGAHTGLYAVFFAKKFNAKVYSFAMLMWIFGSVKENNVIQHTDDTAKGNLILEKANTSWTLSINANTLPDEIKATGALTEL